MDTLTLELTLERLHRSLDGMSRQELVQVIKLLSGSYLRQRQALEKALERVREERNTKGPRGGTTTRGY